jgi:[acyl-carrier-protein] S-malonyltransferase
MIAFLYGGQGSELPRIGADLAAVEEAAVEEAAVEGAAGAPYASGSARAMLAAAGGSIAEAAGAAGLGNIPVTQEGLPDVAGLLRGGGPRVYATEFLQPAMVAVGLALTFRLRAAGIRPVFTAGHSLGELTAWAAAGALSPEDAIRAAAFRGKLMAGLAQERPGGMLSIASGAEELHAAMVFGRGHGELALAAHNGPEAWTVSGEEAALRAVARRYPARRVPVAGAWHSPLMAAGVDPFHAFLQGLSRHALSARFVCNRTGDFPAGEADIPGLIAGQLARPVQWSRTLATLAAAGARRFIILGAGKFLRALIRSALGPDFPVHTTETMGDLERALRELA